MPRDRHVGFAARGIARGDGERVVWMKATRRLGLAYALLGARARSPGQSFPREHRPADAGHSREDGGDQVVLCSVSTPLIETGSQEVDHALCPRERTFGPLDGRTGSPAGGAPKPTSPKTKCRRP